MKKSEEANPSRRLLLQGGALGAGAAALPPAVAQAAPRATVAATPRPNEAMESGQDALVADPMTQEDCGADYMTDVIKALDIPFVATNPASSFRGLHESLVNHGGNVAPEVLTVTHEEIGVAMAHGYAKIADKPLAVMVHGTVGLQHASMAIYNAYCDRAPVIVMGGNTLEAEKRQRAEWVHSAQDPAAMVRDFVKWDDQPTSLRGFGESMARAYRFAMTPPYGPVLLSVDTELQEQPPRDGQAPRVPRKPALAMPHGDTAALDETARLLVQAEHPVILVDRMARNQQGMDLLVELAEVVQCAVIDRGGRTNFPSHHPLNQTFRGRSLLAQADVILALELNDLFASLNSSQDRIHRVSRPITREDVKIVTLGAGDLFFKANFQDFARYQEVTLSVTGDAQTSLPYLIEAVRRAQGRGSAETGRARTADFARRQSAMLEAARREATIGWDHSPITTARLTAELWNQIRDEDWSLVGEGLMPSWRRLWPADKYYRFNGGSGGWGLGYFAPAALGSALANRDHGRISVCFQGDGDLMFCPGTLWTAAHHRIPILYLMFNNRAYHQELMYVQKMASRLSRGMGNIGVGTTLDQPHIDFAMMARSMGVHAEGPITDPVELAPAIGRAIAMLKQGQPALIDVVCEPR